MSPNQVDIHGPRVVSLQFSDYEGNDAGAATDMGTGAINAYDGSFAVATWSSFNAATVAATKTTGFALYGIYFNMLRPIANTTAFHRAISLLWNQSQFSAAYLEGQAGITTPALLPCETFAASCDKTNYIASSGWFPTSAQFTAAANQLVKAGLVPTDSGGNPLSTPFASPPPSTTVWHKFTASGPTFAAHWVWRSSFGRHFFSDILTPTAAKIGLVLSLVGNGKFSYAKAHVFRPSAAAALKDGVLVPGKATCKPTPGTETSLSNPCWGKPGYNTKPVYNSTASCDTCANSWDMYSYGYSSSVNFIFPADAVNTEFGTSNTNAVNAHNVTLDKLSNAVVYATSAGAAAAAGKKWALAQLQSLPFMGIYYGNILSGSYINGWTGYANIPGYGPGTIIGNFYTALNIVQTCYISTPQTCSNGGNYKLGLNGAPDQGGGLNPQFVSTSVYDDDVWGNIYDSPLGTPPTGTVAPLKFSDLLTKTHTQKPLNKFNTGTGTGWFDMVLGKPATTSYAIPKGIMYTFKFLPNLYWSDHVAITAYDYNFSLYLSGVSNPASLPDLATPTSGAAAPPAGLIATHIDPSDPLTIQVIMNSTAAWNLLNIQVPMMPAHIFAPYFNIDQFAQANAVVDTALTPVAAATTGGNFTLGKPDPSTWPAWLKELPNLAIGSGPFMLRTTDETLGSGLLLANPTYYNQYWQIYAINSTNTVKKGTPYALSVPIYEWTFDAVACPSGDHICKVPITSGISAATWSVVNAAGKSLQSGTLTCAGGKCTATIPTSTLKIGSNKVIISVSYTYLGLARTWYQQYGFGIHS